MARFLSVSIFAAIFILANIIDVSSALTYYDVKELGEKALLFNKDDIVHENTMTYYLDRTRADHFIGDLLFGESQANQTIYQNEYEINNPSESDGSGALSFTIPSGIINLVAVINQPGSSLVACDTPKTLGSSTSIVNVRVLGNSTSRIQVWIAAH